MSLLDDLSENIYDDLHSTVNSLTRTKHGVLIEIGCLDWRDHQTERIFHIFCRSVVEQNLTLGDVGGLRVLESHPLLLEYTSDHADLYVSSVADSPEEIMDQLHRIHESVFKGWRKNAYIHARMEYLKSGNGLLARGPVELIEALENQLSGKIRANRGGTTVRSRKSERDMMVMLADERYLICEDAHAIEV